MDANWELWQLCSYLSYALFGLHVEEWRRIDGTNNINCFFHDKYGTNKTKSQKCPHHFAMVGCEVTLRVSRALLRKYCLRLVPRVLPLDTILRVFRNNTGDLHIDFLINNHQIIGKNVISI
jgi:hypothetical protein